MGASARAAELLADEVGVTDDICGEKLFMAMTFAGGIHTHKAGEAITSHTDFKTRRGEAQRLQGAARRGLDQRDAEAGSVGLLKDKA